MNKLARYFADADLRGGYDSLSVAAKKQGLILRDLPKGHFAAFVNRKRDKLKLATSNDLVAYLRLEGRRIDPRVIQTLPQYFDGGAIHYDRAIEVVMRRQFPAWFKTQPENPNSEKQVSP